MDRWTRSARGVSPYELADPVTGSPIAILDLAWPRGLQEGNSQAVAVLVNEPKGTHDTANAHGFRYFTSGATFRDYVTKEIRGGGTAA